MSGASVLRLGWVNPACRVCGSQRPAQGQGSPRQHAGIDLTGTGSQAGLSKTIERRTAGHDVIDQQHVLGQEAVNVITPTLRFQTPAPVPQALIRR